MIKPIIEAQGKKDQQMYCWNIEEKHTKEFLGNAGLILSLDKFKLGEIYYKFAPYF